MQEILDKFTSHLKNTLKKAYALAVEDSSREIAAEHLLLALLTQRGSIAGELLRKTSLDADELKLAVAGLYPMEEGTEHPSPQLGEEAKRALEKAVLTASVHEHKYVGTEHLLMGLLQLESTKLAEVMSLQGVDTMRLRDQIETVLKSTSKFPDITGAFDGKDVPGRAKAEAAAPQPNRPTTPALDFFAVELTDPKIQAGIDPVIGREGEIERAIQILCRRTKNNPVLIGEPGVGKTAIVEGLAKRIVEGKVPAALADKRIFSLDLGLTLAGTVYRGEFEGRLKQIIDEVKANPELIVFIDELHNIMGAGATSGSMDAANILKPALARGEMRAIGATTHAEYKKHIEADGALDRRFQQIRIEEPTPEMAAEILVGLRDKYEKFHNVTITDEAIQAAVQLSERYLTDRQLPDKAIDLIDEAAAVVKVANSQETGTNKLEALRDELERLRARKRKAVVGENFIQALELKAREQELEKAIVDLARQPAARKAKRLGSIARKEIAELIARSTGIPLAELMLAEKDRLLKLGDRLRERVVGQDEAIEAVAQMIQRARSGLADPKRPLASFLFLGPSGVGKTELAKQLAAAVFQDESSMIRIDMSEFSEGFNVSKLIGAPAGYVGYRDETKLTDQVKRKPHSIVLFDEIEKAHRDVHHLLLQILDDGHVTDATGRKINFRNTIIIMTSNVGTAAFNDRAVGFATEAEGASSAEAAKEIRATVTKELENRFPPEFLNRIDKTVVFQPLGKAALENVAKLRLAEIEARLNKDFGVKFQVSPTVLKFIADRSWNPLYGARGVRREIQDRIESPLAKLLLSDEATGATVSLDVAGEEINITLPKKNVRRPVTKRARAKA
jgi:ATP-dependent Clp protease ATP-binding subunit ClpC